MCHQSRRNSPSVIPDRPTASCFATTSRMQRSSISRSASRPISPFFAAARAFRSSGGRSRLPTWSARNGGFDWSGMVESFWSSGLKCNGGGPACQRTRPREGAGPLRVGRDARHGNGMREV